MHYFYIAHYTSRLLAPRPHPPRIGCLRVLRSILAFSRKTRHELSKIFVEHALHVAWIQFRTHAYYPCAWYSGLSYDHWFINKRTLALE